MSVCIALNADLALVGVHEKRSLEAFVQHSMYECGQRKAVATLYGAG